MDYQRSFLNDDDGSISIELLICVPILVWALMSTVVYFDVFRTEANVSRAALTLTDMFSREQTPIDPAYIDGAETLLRTLTFADADPKMRVTVYSYDQSADLYNVIWSRDAAGGSELDDTDLRRYQDAGQLPIMADGDASILVQTTVDYEAPFSVGLGPFSAIDLQAHRFNTFTVARPRYNDTLCFDETPDDGDASSVICTLSTF